MKLSYKLITYKGSGGKVDHIQEFIDDKLYARYKFGYFESCSGCIMIYPMQGGIDYKNKDPRVPYEKKRISFIHDKIEKVVRE